MQAWQLGLDEITNREMLETDSIIGCPKCGSTDVSKPAFTLRSLAIGMLLLGMPIPFMRKQCHCFTAVWIFHYQSQDRQLMNRIQFLIFQFFSIFAHL
jgi:hypothetical protein